MSENKLQITDDQLLQGLEVSPLPEELKERFRIGLPTMTDNQKTRLADLIKQGYKGEQAFETKKQEELAALNDEYAEKMKNAQREEDKYVREEFEKFGAQQDAEEMQSLESEIDQL